MAGSPYTFPSRTRPAGRTQSVDPKGFVDVLETDAARLAALESGATEVETDLGEESTARAAADSALDVRVTALENA